MQSARSSVRRTRSGNRMSDLIATPVTPENLYMIIGEIHSDVKHLMDRETKNEERLSKVEKRQWVSVGVGTCLAFFAAHFGMPFLPHI